MCDTLKTNLLDFDLEALSQFILQHTTEKAFRATQIFKWIHKGVDDFQEMTNLNQSFREWLALHCEIRAPKVLSTHTSQDGTRKWVFQVQGGGAIEAVYIPEPKRGTLCISSQVGCALNCHFCHTAQQGFQRNLTTSEIIGQLWYAEKILRAEGTLKAIERAVTNVVFMGMGEPLLNLDKVLPAVRIMCDNHGYGLSKRRVTISTSGVVPGIERLAQETDVALALSLHAPNNDLRSQIIPLNKKYPIGLVLSACKAYLKERKRSRITIEYVMLHGVNDQPMHAKELVKVLKGIPVKINLIPFNPFYGAAYTCSPMELITRFQDILMAGGIVTTIRKTRGDTINAACGQLAGNVIDKTQRSQKFKERVQSIEMRVIE